ncbi:Rad1-domain-containing protein [Cubamyces lactineus]|nr:Rad1-domain-containing protein [Cubamyces lactineus]
MPEDQPRVLTASVHDFRYFAALLRGVNFANRASVSITADGFTVTVEEARCLTATAFVFSHVFDEFIYNPDAARPSQRSQLSQNDEDDELTATAFEIPLNTLMDCLNIFGTASLAPGTSQKKKAHEDGDDSDGGRARGERPNGKGKGRADTDDAGGNARLDQWFAPGKGTGMRMSYAGPGHPLTLLVAEESGGPTATCEITTWDPEPRLELAFDSDAAVLKIILKSSWLRDALSEIDPSTEKLTIIGNPPPPPGRAARSSAPPCFRLRAVGQFGSTEMDYPNDREVLETCECAHPVSFTYRFSHVARALRALQSSLKTSLRIDDEGLLSLQFMMPAPRRPGRRSEAFIEFWCLPLEND